MKFLKTALFIGALGSAVLAHAQSSTSSTRFESMDITSLTNQAASGNHHAQFFLAKRLQKVKASPKTLRKLSIGTHAPPKKTSHQHS